MDTQKIQELTERYRVLEYNNKYYRKFCGFCINLQSMSLPNLADYYRGVSFNNKICRELARFTQSLSEGVTLSELRAAYETLKRGRKLYHYMSELAQDLIDAGGVAPTPTVYTVTFNANGGTPTPPVQNVQSGSLATAPTPPTQSGFTFVEWRRSGTAFNFSTPITANITLIAEWEAE